MNQLTEVEGVVQRVNTEEVVQSPEPKVVHIRPTKKKEI